MRLSTQNFRRNYAAWIIATKNGNSVPVKRVEVVANVYGPSQELVVAKDAITAFACGAGVLSALLKAELDQTTFQIGLSGNSYVWPIVFLATGEWPDPFGEGDDAISVVAEWIEKMVAAHESGTLAGSDVLLSVPASVIPVVSEGGAQ